jgi:uncharacterized protein
VTPGSSVRVVFRKWGDRPHWEYDARLLGEDRHGTWLGAPAGTRLSRPGADFCSPQDFVTLVPRRAAHVATFYAGSPGSGVDRGSDWVEVYVDVTTRPRWSGRGTVEMVDLDLDVVRGRRGRVWVDDEDEFADHRVRFGYPADIVRLATDSCREVQDAVASRRPPYDGVVGPGWLSRMTGTAPAAGA